MFYLKKKKMKKVLVLLVALFFTGFVFSQTKTEVKVNDLPKSISTFVTKNMEGFTIDKAFKVVDKGVQTYDVLIKKGDKKHVLAFDKDGNFLKKIDNEVKGAAQKTGDQVKTATPPATKPTVPATTAPATTQPVKK
jgi:hypothetical protein